MKVASCRLEQTSAYHELYVAQEPSSITLPAKVTSVSRSEQSLPTFNTLAEQLLVCVARPWRPRQPVSMHCHNVTPLAIMRGSISCQLFYCFWDQLRDDATKPRKTL